MANFLSRIAIRGAGAHSPARPSTIAPPILPGRAPLPDAGSFSDQPGLPPMSQPLEKPASPPIGKGLQPVAPSPVTDSNAPESPSGGQPNAKPADLNPPSGQATAGTSPVTSPVVPQPSASPGPDIVRAPRIMKTEGSERGTPPPSFAIHPEPDAVVRAPRSTLRPPKVEGLDIPLPRLEFSVPAQPDPPMPGLAQPGSPAGQMVQPPTPPAQVAIPAPARTRTAEDEVRPTAPISAFQMPPPAGQPKREPEPKVSIGQIDVQVINQPPAPASAPAVAQSSGDSSSFASSDIERFRYRLV
jgi:hypothetical protein